MVIVTTSTTPPTRPLFSARLSAARLDRNAREQAAAGEPRRTKALPHRLPTLGTKQEDVVVEIEDNGCGIPAAIRDRIFDPFFTTKQVGRGTGQGLAIAHAIVVDRHHGSIAVDSAPNRGTTFTIRIPTRADAKPALSAAA